MRPLVAVGIGACALAATCTPNRDIGIAVSPRNTANANTMQAAAFDLGARIARRFGLTERNVEQVKLLRAHECFSRSSPTALTLCVKPLDGEAQFWLHEFVRESFTPTADSLRRQLLDSLRAQFGHDRVRECSWEFPSDRNRSGCLPMGSTNRVRGPDAIVSAESRGVDLVARTVSGLDVEAAGA